MIWSVFISFEIWILILAGKSNFWSEVSLSGESTRTNQIDSRLCQYEKEAVRRSQQGDTTCHSNSSKCQFDPHSQVLEIQSRIKGRLSEEWGSNQPSRRFIRDGDLLLRKTSGSTRNISEFSVKFRGKLICTGPVKMYLFNDSLVWTRTSKKDPNQNEIAKDIAELKNISVIPLEYGEVTWSNFGGKIDVYRWLCFRGQDDTQSHFSDRKICGKNRVDFCHTTRYQNGHLHPLKWIFSEFSPYVIRNFTEISQRGTRASPRQLHLKRARRQTRLSPLASDSTRFLHAKIHQICARLLQYSLLHSSKRKSTTHYNDFRIFREISANFLTCTVRKRSSNRRESMRRNCTEDQLLWALLLFFKTTSPPPPSVRNSWCHRNFVENSSCTRCIMLCRICNIWWIWQ